MPSVDMLKEMANFFHTSVDYIIGYSESFSGVIEFQQHPLSNEERELLDTYRSIAPSQQEVVRIVANSYKKTKK